MLKNPAYHFSELDRKPETAVAVGRSARSPKQSPRWVRVETRHMQALLKAQINKTDRNDARGIAQMMRVGLYRPVHVETLRVRNRGCCRTIASCCSQRRSPLRTICAGLCVDFGLKVGMIGKVRFEARIRELVENLPDLATPVEPLLSFGGYFASSSPILHRRLLAIVRDDEACRRLTTTPGVGPVVALTYRATVDVPARFRKSRESSVACLGDVLQYQSGEIDLERQEYPAAATR